MYNSKTSLLRSKDDTDGDVPHFNAIAANNQGSNDAYSMNIGQSLLGGQQDGRILTYSHKAPEPTPFDTYQKHKLYQSDTAPVIARHVQPQVLEKLKAPGLSLDFMHNLVAWSSQNLLAVGLASSVYIFNAVTRSTYPFISETTNNETVCSLAFDATGKFLSIGCQTYAEIWDVYAQKRLRKIVGQHLDEVVSQAWRECILTSGSCDSTITNNDLRVKQSLVSTFTGHTGPVCGLSWDPSGRYLASGSADCTVKVWDATMSSDSTEITKPLYTINESQGTTKAIAWCPWKTDTLAIGGGLNDGVIRIYNTQMASGTSATMVNSISTGSQVCTLHFAPHDKELISTQGFRLSSTTSRGGSTNGNCLSIFRYPSLVEIQPQNASTTQFNDRVLFSAINPEGTQIALTEGLDNTGTAGSIFIMKMWESLEDKQARLAQSGNAKAKGAGFTSKIR